MPRGQRNTETAPAAPKRPAKTPADRAVDEYRSIEQKLTAAQKRKDDAQAIFIEAVKEITYREKLLAAAALNPDLPEGFDPEATDDATADPQPTPEPTVKPEPTVAPDPDGDTAPPVVEDPDDPFAGL